MKIGEWGVGCYLSLCEHEFYFWPVLKFTYEQDWKLLSLEFFCFSLNLDFYLGGMEDEPDDTI